MATIKLVRIEFSENEQVTFLILLSHALKKFTGPREQLREAKWYLGGKYQGGQELKIQGSDSKKLQGPTNVQYTITIDPQKYFYITEISLFVDQSSSIGQAYIEDGGPGYDFMRLVLQAKETTYIDYRLDVYGRDYQQ